MAKTVRRKLFLFGLYSLALLPPKKWLTKLGVKEGDDVEIVLDTARKRLIVKFDDSNNADKQQKKDSASPSKKDTPKEGWEPIPHI